MALFGGQQPAAQSAPSLFGAPQPTSASLFGAPQSSASLFGAPQSSASLFGAPQSSASLFGAPQSSSSLFGASQSSASLFGAPAQSSASLFGAPSQPSASLFGAPAQSSASIFAPPAQSSGSLFGGTPAQSSASLFGAPASSASLFGAPATGSSLFAGIGNSQPTTLLGQSQPQQGQPPHQQTQPPKEITGRTPISQLPQHFQTDLFAVERHLREQRNKSSKLWSKRSHVDNEISQVKAQAAAVTRRLVKLRAALELLRANSDALKAAVRTERASAEPVVIALDNYKAGHVSQVGFLGGGNSFRYGALEGNVNDRMTRVPDEYFTRITDELESRAHEYKGEIDEIADYLRAQGVVLSRKKGPDGAQKAKRTSLYMGMSDGVNQRHMEIDGAASNQAMASKGKTIEDVIRRQYEYFMVVASHVAGVHENLRTVREHFLRLIRVRDPDTVDPFQQADLREKAAKERRRLIAEKRASEGTVEYNGTPAMSTQGALMTNQSAGFGQASGGFGSTSVGLLGPASAPNGATSLGTSDGNGAGQSRRMSSGRRRRS